MRKLFPIFILLVFLLTNCNSSVKQVPEVPKEQAANLNDKAVKDAAKLNNILDQFAAPSQFFEVPADRESVIKGEKGTTLFIDPQDLELVNGQKLGSTIKVELKELTSQSDLLRNNTQTVSNGKLLVSGGAYYIHITSDGEQAKLKSNATLSVAFPRITERKMELFYGTRDSLDRINWEPAGQEFAAKAIKKEKPRSEEVTSVKIVKSELDQIFDYIENDSTPYQSRSEAEKRNEVRNKLYEDVYDAIQLKALEWINVDMFLDAANTTDLKYTFAGPAKIESANILVVFTDMNSVIQEYYFAYGKNFNAQTISGLPVGNNIKFIAYSILDDKVYAYSTKLKLKTGQSIQVELKEMGKDALRQILK